MLKVLEKALCVAAAAMFIMAPAANAQEKLTLKFAHLFPETHYLWQQGGKHYTDAVTAAGGGQVQFEVYPAGQLGKDYLTLLKSGIADIVLLVPSYAPEKFPLSSVADLPSLYDTSCQGTEKFWSVAKDGGLLNEAEYKALGLHVLWVSVLDTYRVMTVSKEIADIAAVNGLKIRANAGAMDKTVRTLGSVPIRVPSPELYDALTRGTIDGALYPYTGMPTFKLENVLHYAVEGPRLGSGSILFAMSEQRWQSLPENVKTLLNEAAMPSQKHLCEYQDAEGTRIREKIVAENKFKLVTLSAEQAKAWNDRVSVVAEEWAAERDGTTKNGTALLKAFREAGGSQ